MRKLLIILGILATVSCKPEVYLGPLDSPLGNWKCVDSRYRFAGEDVYEDSVCFYSAISFYKDSLCCIQGIKGAFKWTYDSDSLVVDSTIWKVVEMSGRQMELDYLGRIPKPATVPSAPDAPDTQTEGDAENGNDDDDSAVGEDCPTVEYKGRTIETDGSAYWYLNSTGERIPCFPKEKSEEDGSVTVICWWDTRSDLYKPF